MLKNKKAFTIIELIVVIAILGILVLLATPRFKGHIEKAHLTNIKNDIKVAETVVGSELAKSGSLDKWGKPKEVDLNEAKNNNRLYNVKGLMSGADEIEGDEFVEIDKSDINSKLKGDFYANQGGKVYYLDNVSVDDGIEEGNDEGETPDDTQNKDFEWVEGPEGYEVTEKGKGYYHYIGDDEVVTIPHEINGHPMTSYYNMFSDTYVKKVISDNENITDMSWMFYKSHYSLDLSELDTSSVINMEGMFDSSKATSLNLSGLDTSNVKNMQGTFAGLNAELIGLEDLNVSNVENMAGTFAAFQGTKINISKWNTSKVTDMASMFGEGFVYKNSNGNSISSAVGDNNLKEIIGLEKLDTSNVENMNAMFSKSQATSLDLSSFNTSNVTDMGHMFQYSQAKSLDLSSFDTSNVTDMSFMFANSQAKSLDLSSFDTSSDNIDMRMMFNVAIPDVAEETEVYARTQEDADKFRANGTPTIYVTFIVK